MKDVRILILGTGGMAKSHVEGYAAAPGARIVAGIDTNTERLAAFQAAHNIPHGFTSIADALAWGEFDAVSNVTPDGVHHLTTLPFLAAGKHVLCEKPLAVNHADAADMAEKAAMAGVINMVNLTYRNGEALMEAHRLIAEGAIGEIRHFEASYLQSWLTQPAWGDWQTETQWLWRLSTSHGSNGVLGDVGVHIVDFATFAANSAVAEVSCRLTTFDKAPDGKIGEYVLDANDSAVMHVRLANGAVGVIHTTRFATGHLNDLTLRIHGTHGALEITDHMGKRTLRGCLGEDRFGPTWRDLPCPEVKTNYVRFVEAVQAGTPVLPDFARGAALQKVLDCAVQSNDQHGLSLSL